MIYFIRLGDTGPVKIGTAFNVEQRLKSIQTSHHETLTLLRTFDGGRQAEMAFHKHFATHRIKGEWFNYHSSMDAPDLLAAVYPRADGEKEVPPTGNRLRAWLAEHSMNESEFGRKIGISRSMVCRLTKGERRPSLKMLQKIMLATSGSVGLQDF